MKIIRTREEWAQFRKNLGHTAALGFVPTMGALHPGHVSLIKASRDENASTVVSIFVNPTQFNREDDLKHYPRPLEADLDLLKKESVEACFLPDAEMLYPDAFHFQIHETHHSKEREGAYRPGHFTGVLTVVMKLFNIIKPTRAYFGEKDYQQLQLIQGMVHAFFMDIELRSCPTVREESCLPLSSRNQRLDAAELALARQFAHLFHSNLPVAVLCEKLTALGIEVEYVEEQDGRRFAAVNVGKVRLIDNISLTTTVT